MSSEKLLEVKNLKTYFSTEEGLVKAVDDVSFSIDRGEIVGIVGESGCGKSVTAFSIAQLVPTPPGRFAGGEIFLEGEDILKMSKEEVRKIRGNKIGIVFQEPMTALNPVVTIGAQIGEVLKIHTSLTKEEIEAKTLEMLEKIGIADPKERINAYPHQLSGGMRQRIMIAIALINNPSLLIADEPTTALDVTIQAQIMELMEEMQKLTNTAIMLITHDLAVIAETVHRVIVMYAGKIIEEAPVKQLFDNPQHPYTRGLLKSIPVLGEDNQKLEAIPGRVPSLAHLPDGCAFANRCKKKGKRCLKEIPSLIKIDENHTVSCFLYSGGVE